MNLLLHCHRSTHETAELEGELNAGRPGSAATVSQDVLDVTALARLPRTAVETFGSLDLLVNNASSFLPTPVRSASLEQWEDLFGTNVRAPFFLAQAAAGPLSKSRGSIVNIIDIHGERPMPGYPIYSAAKAGLAMLTRALAVELAPEIRVNGIAPGAILWAGHEQPQARASILARVPMKRRGAPADIVKATLYLAFEAPYVTGQILAVDGGRSLHM
jgi:pteridine reductase